MYDRWVARIKENLPIVGYDRKKELRELKSLIGITLFFIIIGFLIAIYDGVINSPILWIQILIFFLLSIVYSLGLFVVTVLKSRTLGFAWGFGFVFAEWILAQYLDAVMPSGSFVAIYVLALSFIGFGIIVNELCKINVLTKIGVSEVTTQSGRNRK